MKTLIGLCTLFGLVAAGRAQAVVVDQFQCESTMKEKTGKIYTGSAAFSVPRERALPPEGADYSLLKGQSGPISVQARQPGGPDWGLAYEVDYAFAMGKSDKQYACVRGFVSLYVGGAIISFRTYCKNDPFAPLDPFQSGSGWTDTAPDFQGDGPMFLAPIEPMRIDLNETGGALVSAQVDCHYVKTLY